MTTTGNSLCTEDSTNFVFGIFYTHFHGCQNEMVKNGLRNMSACVEQTIQNFSTWIFDWDSLEEGVTVRGGVATTLECIPGMRYEVSVNNKENRSTY